MGRERLKATFQILLFLLNKVCEEAAGFDSNAVCVLPHDKQIRPLIQSSML